LVDVVVANQYLQEKLPSCVDTAQISRALTRVQSVRGMNSSR
jgi:hypothetical protein